MSCVFGYPQCDGKGTVSYENVASATFDGLQASAVAADPRPEGNRIVVTNTDGKQWCSDFCRRTYEFDQKLERKEGDKLTLAELDAMPRTALAPVPAGTAERIQVTTFDLEPTFDADGKVDGAALRNRR